MITDNEVRGPGMAATMGMNVRERMIGYRREEEGRWWDSHIVVCVAETFLYDYNWKYVIGIESEFRARTEARALRCLTCLTLTPELRPRGICGRLNRKRS